VEPTIAIDDTAPGFGDNRAGQRGNGVNVEHVQETPVDRLS